VLHGFGLAEKRSFCLLDHHALQRLGGRQLCPLVALSGPLSELVIRPLLGVNRTSQIRFLMSANDPKRTFADFWVLSDPLALRLGLSFEGCDPLAQLDGFELRVHGGGEAGKAGKHRTFT
jgi:hypothetical protein